MLPMKSPVIEMKPPVIEIKPPVIDMNVYMENHQKIMEIYQQKTDEKVELPKMNKELPRKKVKNNNYSSLNIIEKKKPKPDSAHLTGEFAGSYRSKG